MEQGPPPGALEGFLGLRNTQRPERMPAGALLVAENVHLDDSGALERREGYVKALNLPGVSDAFAHPNGDYLLAVAEGQLLVISADLSERVLAAGLQDTRLSWAHSGDRMVYAGMHDAGCVVNANQWQPLRLYPPLQPAVVSDRDGDLPAGEYRIALVYVEPDSGLQSPASRPRRLVLGEPSGLTVLMTPREGFEIAVYLTSANGQTFYRVGSYPGGSFRIKALPESSLALPEEQLQAHPLPVGITALAVHEGRLFAATYNAAEDLGILWFSVPFAWHWFRLAEDFRPLPGRIEALASTAQGLLIGTSRQIALRDGDDNLQVLADYGVTPGLPFALDREGKVAIWTRRGAATFPPYELLADGKFSPPPGEACQAALVEREGLKQFVVVSDEGGEPFNPYP